MSLEGKVRNKSRRKAAAWNLAFSYSTIVYAVVSGIVMVPLYLKFLPVELYGAWLATGNVLAWVTIVDPGLASVVGQRTAHAYGQGDAEALVGYTQAGLLVSAILVTFVFLLSLAVSGYLPALVNFENAGNSGVLRESFVIAAVGACLMLFSFSFGVVNRAMLGSVAHGLITLGGNLCLIVLTLILLFLGFGLYALAWGLFARGVIALGGGATYLTYRIVSEKMPLARDFSRLKEILGLLSFTSLSKIGSMASKHVDAFLVARFLGPEIVPVYVLTRRPFKIGQTFVSRIATSVGPSISHLAGEGGRRKIRRILCRLLRLNFWLLGLAFAGFLALIEPFVSLWVGSEFFAGPAVALLLVLLFLAEMLSATAGVYCMALGDIKRSSVAVLAHAVVAFPLAVAGVHFFGLLGLVGGPLVAFLAVHSWYFSRSLIRRGGLERVDVAALWRELLRTSLVTVVVVFCFRGVEPAGWVAFILWALLLALTFVILLVLISAPAREEFLTGWGLFRRRLGRNGKMAGADSPLE